jgi:N-acetyl-anhydromuramyl-L-alanine amidase AmpD
MLKIIQFGDFKPKGKQKRKKQIVLCHTSREVQEYLTSLKHRYNGQYDKVPNYIITRTGEILQLLPDNTYSNFLDNESVNKNSIVVCLENLGWLEKKPLTNYYINWKGSIYNDKAFEKKWRDFFFWQPYTPIQLEMTAELCKHLSESLNIEKRCVGHNTRFEGVSNYEGIVSKSNYNSIYTDLNPSFNFETFTKHLENEQFA